VSLALSLEICLLAFYKVLLHALNLTIGTLPEATPRSGTKRCASLPPTRTSHSHSSWHLATLFAVVPRAPYRS
jgi:hypothetical protein